MLRARLIPERCYLQSGLAQEPRGLGWRGRLGQLQRQECILPGGQGLACVLRFFAVGGIRSAAPVFLSVSA